MVTCKTSDAKCVACTGGTVIRDIRGVEGFCSDCGFVLPQEGEGEPPDYQPARMEDPATVPESWVEVAKIRSATDE